MERIPFWERQNPKRPQVRNLIKDEEIGYLRYRDPHEDLLLNQATQKEKDIRHVLKKVDGFFDVRPEESLLSWLLLWKAKNPQEAKKTVYDIRTGIGRTERFAYRTKGVYIYFSRLPKGEFEDWSEAQQDAWRDHERRYHGARGRPVGTGHPLTKVWHCDQGHEWLSVTRAKQCPHTVKGAPCPGVVLPGNARGGTLQVANRSKRQKPVQ